MPILLELVSKIEVIIPSKFPSLIQKQNFNTKCIIHNEPTRKFLQFQPLNPYIKYKICKNFKCYGILSEL